MRNSFLVGVKGESFVNEDGSSRQDIIRKLRTGQQVQLVPEPSNSHDRNAVKVLTSNGEQIGYLPSDARDSDTLLKGEPIGAKIHAIHGGTNWLMRLLGKKYVGVVLHVTKGEIDWERRKRLEGIASSADEKVSKALDLEKQGETDAACEAMIQAIEFIRNLTISDAHASAHRHMMAPVDRLSLLLERKKAYGQALAVIDEWEQAFDPVMPSKAVCETIRKRAERLRQRISSAKSKT